MKDNLNVPTPYKIFVNGKEMLSVATESAARFYYKKALPVYKNDLVVLKFNNEILDKNR